MTKRSLTLAIALLVLSLPVTLQAQTFGAVLTGAQEVPPNISPAFGSATFTLSPDHTQITANMTVSGLSTALVGAHIHGKAGAGTNAPIVLNLDHTQIVNGKLSRTYTITKELGDDLALNTTLYYINVHTTNFPGGEIRGQLTSATGTGTSFAGDLRGSGEVPPTGSHAVGAFLVTFGNDNSLTYEVHASQHLPGITAAHIHRGAAGVNGPIVIGLTTSTSTFVNGRLQGTFPPIDAALVNEIKANPAGFYVNVHTTAFPGGEIRGQLAPANEFDIAVAGRVVGATATFVTDTRVFNPSQSTAVSALLEYFPAGGANTSAAAVIPVDVPARGTAVLDDVTGAAHLNSSGTTGAIRVSSGSPLVVTSRIYADFRPVDGGTLGQFVPGFARSAALRRGVMPQITHITGVPTGSRTNVGFFNPNTGPVDVRLELRDAAGALIATANLTLPPLSQQQNLLSNVFAGLAAQTNATLSFDAGAPIFGYASIVDNKTSDQTYVFAQADGAL